MMSSTLSSKINGREGGGAGFISMNPAQIDAEAGVLDVVENNKEETRKLKRQERNRSYYSRNIEWLREKARNRYYLAREKEGTSEEETERSEIKSGSIPIFSILLALLAVAAIVAIMQQGQGEESSVAPPPAQNYNDFDIGGGKIIKIPTTVQL